MGLLHDIGLKHGTDKATYHGYCDFYEEHLPKPESGRVKRLLEIGVKDGASLRMWRDYYPDAEIVGIDINPPIEVEGCKVLRIDATDPSALFDLMLGFDVIVDDGSHMTKDQLISFELLYTDGLCDGGTYVMEDIHTSFYTGYVNSARTTFDYLRTHYPDALLYARVPGDLSDSVTMLIRKR